MTGTFLSLIPPFVMILLVILTKRVLLSLGVGIILGALFIHKFHIGGALLEVWNSFFGIFIDDGAPNYWNINLLLFLLFLGMMTSFMTASGGAKAFGDWAVRKIQTKKGAQTVPAVLGLVLFIDDYFNSLTVGQVSRPVTDRHKVSRAKLSYLIDSTAAPVTVLSPISSWGATIIGLVGTAIAANEITDLKAFDAFVQMMPLNFYAIAAIILVFIVALTNLNIGPMKKHEERAQKTGDVVGPNNAPGELGNTFVEVKNGRIYQLLLPILVLVAVTVVHMFLTDMNDPALSLVYGGLTAVIVALIAYMFQKGTKTPVMDVIGKGIQSMLPAIYILIFAWMISTIIDVLATGDYLATVVKEMNMNLLFLPIIVFVLAGLMAFATGTSWGTFTIMIPIAAQIAAAADQDMFLISIAAVLAGAVFGDHCSPISDTSILSSTGAGVYHIDHVITQLPYAIIAAIATIIGYLIFGVTGMVWLALVSMVVALFILPKLYILGSNR
ncbi:Na+/H+ antiporter NhaC family protein [Salirhabdus salicampi]|uniref:Na+/H+ antiporter NhaC family protein n=1 Tax=Salirhabdus salicampi TaxID=476102 RepID=UPI0020C2569B|nr:Na+/H+ antiporter NhaC family protein [Salirhabdus salicampi]MCP8617744.1 Na+/H+ antiporter NhaC family protein [Salirhabdus salicampi]